LTVPYVPEAGSDVSASAAMVTATGILGLISIVAYMAVLASGAGALIGLVERGIVYPFLIGFIIVGAALRKRKRVAR
jgi:hypothetical protein